MSGEILEINFKYFVFYILLKFQVVVDAGLLIGTDQLQTSFTLFDYTSQEEAYT